VVSVTSLAAMTPPSPPLTVTGIVPAGGSFMTPVTITGVNFDPVVENNLVTFVDLVNQADVQVDLSSVSDSNTVLDGDLGQLCESTSAPVRVHVGTGGDLAGFIYAGSKASSSFNIEGFAMNPAGGNSATGCGTAACNGFNLMNPTPQTVNTAASGGSIAFDITSLAPWLTSETGTVRAYLGAPRAVVQTKFNFNPSSTLDAAEAAEHIANHLNAAFQQVESQFASVYNQAPGVTAVSGGTSIITMTSAGGLTPVSWLQISKA
jgi:hypothetical protein